LGNIIQSKKVWEYDKVSLNILAASASLPAELPHPAQSALQPWQQAIVVLQNQNVVLLRGAHTKK
jgi:hypothetical protein